VESDFNGGYAAGMNLGARYALKNKSDYILLMNNDIVVTANFLEPMIKIFDSDNQIGIVSPKVGYTDNKDMLYCAGGRIDKILCGGVSEYKGKEFSKYGNESREISLAEGCCLLIKSDVYKTIGFMNEKYFMYFEDLDFSTRVREKYKLFYSCESIIYHTCGAGKSWGEFGPIYNYYYTRNRLLFFKESFWLYRIYVTIFSTLNVIAKSIFLAKSLMKNKKKKNIIKSFQALWRGYFDGLLMHYDLKIISPKEA
jgi:GT2 family glycosyltransferase